MKIGSNSQSLISLASLLDATKQQQREDQKPLAETRETRVQVRDSQRQQLIDQNRDALKKIQEDLRLRNLAKLKENSTDVDNEAAEYNLNLRESFLPKPGQPAFQKLGQLIDIKI